MAGVHLLPFFTRRGTGSPVIHTFPPDSIGDLIVIHGTAALNVNGQLVITNTNNLDSAFAYFSSMPSTIADFEETMTTSIPSSQTMGLLGAASFTATTQNDGYRHDYSAGVLRLFRYDATVITPIGSNVILPAGYYTTPGNPVVQHFKRVANVFTAWMSASGQSDTATCTATDGTYASGRCGMLTFSTGAQVPIDGYSCIF